MNEQLAKEWLNKAWHHLSSAKLLYDAQHYTDIIAVELHYTIEITLRSFLAYENKQIKKTHDLLELSLLVENHIQIDELNILSLATKYHIREAYPPRNRRLPSINEVKEVLDFTEELFEKVCYKLEIKLEEVKI